MGQHRVVQPAFLVPSIEVGRLLQDCVVSNSKLKLPSADSSDLSVKDIVMRYLCTSGWLPGVTV